MKLVGERRAIAAIVFAFFFIYFLLGGLQAEPAAKAFIFALAGCYGLAFFSLVAGYFWARWYSVGIGLFGMIISAVSLWQVRNDPEMWDAYWKIFAFVGSIHLVATVMLWGDSVASAYDGQTRWREKLHMDDNAVQRLGRSVIRAGVGLPFVLAYAFAPKEPASTALAILALGLVAFGFRAMVRAKTWGVLALALSGSLMITLAGADHLMGAPEGWVLRPALAGGLLLSAAVPWFAPMMRKLSAVQ